jgi:CDGSH-type Zn-finger protein
MSSEKEHFQDKEMGETEKPQIKVTKNGPYHVKGNVLLLKMVIETDDEGYPYRWIKKETYPHLESYLLCRCGKSEKTPYCDNTHKKIDFDGTETAGYACYEENVKVFDGPELKLTDNKPLCVGSGFCTRAGNIWNLTTHSDLYDFKDIAIQEAWDCPSGRLVVWDKSGKPLEPDFEPSIVLTEDQYGVIGPLWVRGEIEIESMGNIIYEKRNRVTLCRCGKSEKKPLCDGSHLDT